MVNLIFHGQFARIETDTLQKLRTPHTHTHTHTCMHESKYFSHTHTNTPTYVYILTLRHWDSFILHSRLPHKCGRSSQLPLLGRQPPPPCLPPALQRFFSCFTHTILNSIKSLRIRQTCAAPRHVDDATTSTRRHLRDMHSVHAIYWVQREDTGYRVPGAGYSRYSQTQMTFVFSCH